MPQADIALDPMEYQWRLLTRTTAAQRETPEKGCSRAAAKHFTWNPRRRIRICEILSFALLISQRI